MKLCKDCKHYVGMATRDDGRTAHLCKRTAVKHDPCRITGEVTLLDSSLMMCKAERYNEDDTTNCGEAGQCWERRKICRRISED